MNVKILIFSVVGGVIITLLTGLILNTSLIGASHYGYPLAWLIRLVIAPQHFPWRVITLNLIVDIIVWAVIVGVVLLILTRIKK